MKEQRRKEKDEDILPAITKYYQLNEKVLCACYGYHNVCD